MVRVLTRVPITFEVAGGGAEHAPLVVGRVRGRTTRLVLDTGSDVHLLTKALVDEIGLAFDEGEEGVDHSGATMPSWAVEDVALELGDIEVTLHEVVAIPAPQPFPGWGIGGILSPQHLHSSARVVIDLVGNELLLVDTPDDALAAWLTERSPDMVTLSLDRDPGFPTIVVEAAIRPFPAIPTLLNTGGRGTEFASDAVPGLVDAATTERLGAGVSGTDVTGSMAGEAALVVAGRELIVPSLAVRPSVHGPKGLVGTDVLRGTILTVGAEQAGPVFWQVPASRG